MAAKDAADRFNVRIRIPPEARGGVLVKTGHDSGGNITIEIGPEAFEGPWNIAHARPGAFSTLSSDVLTEELIHAADLAVQRDKWRARRIT